MIENINEFVKNFRERLSSPFFFSFIVSWMCLNWKVTIALLWYNSALYPNQGDLIKFIDANTSSWQSIYFPVFSSGIYTLIGRNLITGIVGLSSRWGGNLDIWISKGSNVPMRKFLKYRKLYTDANLELEKIIKDESKTIENYNTQIQKNNELQTTILTLKNTAITVQAEKDDLVRSLEKANSEIKAGKSSIYLSENYKNMSLLNGTWDFRFDNALGNIHYGETFVIAEGIIQVLVGESRKISVYKIDFFLFDTVNFKMTLILKLIHGTAESNFLNRIDLKTELETTNVNEKSLFYRKRYELALIQELDVMVNGNSDIVTLTGTENVETMISYKRKNA